MLFYYGMDYTMNRRRLLQLGATLFAAPAIVRAESLMRVCVVPTPANKMTITQKMVAEFLARDMEIFRDAWARNAAIQFVRHESGIITLKRPNYSETRLWPESEK